MKNKVVTHITVWEYARLTTTEVPATAFNTARVPASAFDWLTAESARLRGAQAGANLVQLENRRELRLDNYVGVLEAPCGTRIEILPKALGPDDDFRSSRRLLQKMLSRCLNLDPRQSGPTALQAFNVPLTEWVANQFLQAVEHILHQGVRFDYRNVQEPLRHLRGRLLLNQQLRQAPGRGQLLHVEHARFDADRAENRLIRTALEQVNRYTRVPTLRHRACTLLQHLQDIPSSRHIPSDWRKWRTDRLTAHYAPAKPWCSLVLQQQMPLTAAGTHQGLSLLFPMERVYEHYVGVGLRRWLPEPSHLQCQVARRYLTRHREQNWFQLRPDFLIQHPYQTIIADAKWKLLDASKNDNINKYNLSQSDFYQLHAYGHTYLNGQGQVWLLYPKTASFQAPLPPFHFTPNLSLLVIPFDLENCAPVLPEQLADLGRKP